MVKVGDTLGDFTLVREVGRGSMGVVYEATQKSLGRRVAVKVLTPAAAGDPVWVERFRAEAGAAARLSHPGILPVYAVGEEAGVPYFAMELVDGRDLTRIAKEDGLLAPREAARIARDVALALDHAHVQGIVHRDVKPGNVMVRRDGRAVVMDFGLAKHVGSSSLTTTGSLVGTPYYMSPEQAIGDRAKVGPKSDVYGLGATLYEMLAGRPPFLAENAVALLRLIAEKEAAPPSAVRPEVPRDLETIALCCMDKRPERRYASCRALAEDLDRFLRDEPISKRRPGPVERLRRVVEKNRVASAAVAAAVLLLGSGFFVFRYVLEDREAEHRKEIDTLLEDAKTALERGDAEGALRTLSSAAADEGSPEQRQRVEDAAREASKAGVERAKRDADPDALRRVLAAARMSGKQAPSFLRQQFPPATLTVKGLPPGATASVRPLGDDTADPVALEVPIVGRSLDVGQYLLSVEAPGRAPARAALVLLESAANVEIDVALPKSEDVPAGMVYLAGQFARGTFAGRSVAYDIPPFLLDRTEVTVDAYARFLAAIADPAERAAMTPAGWTSGRPPVGSGSKPVTGVTWAMADAFASSVGKRLPTDREFEFAAFDVAALGHGSRRAADSVKGAGRPNVAAAQSKGTLPVDRPEAFTSPSGAVDLLGNAAEWTASSPLGDPWEILVVGGSYEQALGPAVAVQLPSLSSPTVGFRCATSTAAPLTALDAAASPGARRIRLGADGSVVETAAADGGAEKTWRVPFAEGDQLVRLGTKFDLDVAAGSGVEVRLPPGSVVGRTGNPLARVGTRAGAPTVEVPSSAGERLRIEVVVPSARPPDDDVRDVLEASGRLIEAMRARRTDVFLAGLAPEFVSERVGDRAAVAAMLATRPRGGGGTAVDPEGTIWGAARQGDRVVVRQIVDRAEKRKPGATGPMRPIREIIETYFRHEESSGRWLATYQAARPIADRAAKAREGGGAPEEGMSGK